MKKLRITVMLVSLLTAYACSNFDFGKKQPQAYQTFTIEAQDLVEHIDTDGSIEMEKNIEVFAPVEGRLEKLFVKDGDIVAKGQQLGVMSSSTRVSLLDIAGNKNKDEKKYWDNQMRPTNIYAPVSGKVVDIKYYEGETIRGQLMNITKGMIVRSNIDESDLPSVRIGQQVRIVFDVIKGQEISGEVSKINERSRVVNNVNVYPVEVKIPDEALKKLSFDAKIGMSVTLQFNISEKKAAKVLPLEAVGGKNNTTISALDLSDRPIKIKLGKVYDDYVEVLSDTPVGESVRLKAKSKETKQKSLVPFFLKDRKK